MDKKVIAFIALIAVVLIAIGGYMVSSQNTDQYGISDLNVYFDFSNEPVTSWDESTHEYKFKQNVKTFDQKEFKDISMDILFLKDGKQFDKKTVNIDQTNNQSFDLDFNVTLDQEPQEILYNVTSATEI